MTLSEIIVANPAADAEELFDLFAVERGLHSRWPDLNHDVSTIWSLTIDAIRSGKN